MKISATSTIPCSAEEYKREVEIFRLQQLSVQKGLHTGSTVTMTPTGRRKGVHIASDGAKAPNREDIVEDDARMDELEVMSPKPLAKRSRPPFE